MALSYTPKPLTVCSSLFDHHEASSIRANLEYMASKYSFFVPNIENLTNPVGLAKYLLKKVSERHQCLFCNKIFSSMTAVRCHMVDLGHTMLGTDSPSMAREIKRFFNGRTTAEDGSDYSDFSDSEASEVEDPRTILPDGSLLLSSGYMAVPREFAYIYNQKLRALPILSTGKRPKTITGVSRLMLANGVPVASPKEQKKLDKEHFRNLHAQRVTQMKMELNCNKIRNLGARAQIAELYTYAK